MTSAKQWQSGHLLTCVFQMQICVRLAALESQANLRYALNVSLPSDARAWISKSIKGPGLRVGRPRVFVVLLPAGINSFAGRPNPVQVSVTAVLSPKAKREEREFNH
jgi:hypothetical protein